MIDFTYDVLPGRVLFGVRSRHQVSAEIDRLRCSRALVLSTPGQSHQAKDLAQKIGQLAAGIFSGAVMHTPVSLHHKRCHVLGGTFNLPHAETHTILLPHVVAYNCHAEPEVMSKIAKAIGARDAATGLYAFIHGMGVKQCLREIGMPEAGIEQAALLVSQNPYSNPRKLETKALSELIRRAWVGEPPRLE